ncbi:LanC-like protein GCL2 [Linum grandiflorum]
MTDRFFPNIMPDYVSEARPTADDDPAEPAAESHQDPLVNLLSMPYSSLSQRFQRAALDLKETIVMETWGTSGQPVRDFTLYSGTLGTAYLLFRTYQVTDNKPDLLLCLEIVKACDSASSGSRDVTFLCGRGGVCALGAVAAKYADDETLTTYYLNQFDEVKLSSDHPDEFLHGRSGFLWACSFINKHIGEGTIPHTKMRTVADEIIKNGREMAKDGGPPLMYEWYGERYWGAAHGLAGIMHALMDVELTPDEVKDVKDTLYYMIKNRFPSKNYPSSEEDCSRDVLVHWCHGAPGIALTFIKAAKVFGDTDFLEAAMDAAAIIWNRGLLKRVGICHGISGNAYVFLSLYRMTGNHEFIYRGKAFACFLLDRAHKLISEGEMQGGDSPHSLFEGIGGMAYLHLDMIDPLKSRFPAYELD